MREYFNEKKGLSIEKINARCTEQNPKSKNLNKNKNNPSISKLDYFLLTLRVNTTER